MKTKLLLFFVSIIFSGLASGQAVTGKVEYQKSEQPAAIIELPYSPETVEGAIKEHLAKSGSKPNQSKGFTGYKNVQLSLADAAPSDVYFKIDRKSRKENNMSVVYMVVTKRDENPATRSSVDNGGIDQAQAFLNNIGPVIDSYSLELEIRQQEEELKKAQKKYDNLMEEGRDLEKRKKSLEDKLVENSQNQEKQQLEIEKQRAAMDNLVKKRL